MSTSLRSVRPLDALSIKRIALLHPKVRENALAALEDVNEALTGRAMCRVISTLRTFPEQNALYNLGRTVVNPDGRSAKKPMGNIVTNSKAGTSYHNYGLAPDFVLVIDGKTASWDSNKDWDGDRQADWMEVVTVFKRHGWQWGGDWRTFKDMPHFQKTFGYTWQDLLKLHTARKVDKDGYVLI